MGHEHRILEEADVRRAEPQRSRCHRTMSVMLLVVTAACTGAARTAGAQTKGVVVRVRDQVGAPVPHALVEVEGGRGRVTDDNGGVMLTLPSDSVKVMIRRMGYAPFTGRIGRSATGEYEAILRAFAQTLAAVSVVTRGTKTVLESRGFYDRMLRAQRGAFNAEFVTPEELDARPGARAIDFFRGRRMLKVAGAGRGAYLVGRSDGRGACPVSVFVDGILMRSLVRNGNVAIDDFVDVNAVAAIEMYASAAQAPGELIPLVGSAKQGSCGVVAIWTGGRH